MTADPRVVFGMAAYNRADSLARTLESLLSQTRDDFAIVIVDDRPSPEVKAIVDTYSRFQRRIVYEPNAARLGMIGNWRRAFIRSLEVFPGSKYFAWASDHDIWHPRWLEVLVPVLDEHPEVVLAYPQMMRVYTHTNGRRRVNNAADTMGITKPEQRMRVATAQMTAGNGIYGLFRAGALARAGVFRPVLLPDRQLLVELSLLGQFKHVPEILWYREVAGVFSYGRQRRMLFAGRSPLYTYLPASLQHLGVLLWDFCVRGRGKPAIGRLTGVRYAVLQLWFALTRDLLRNDARWRTFFQRTAVPSVR